MESRLSEQPEWTPCSEDEALLSRPTETPLDIAWGVNRIALLAFHT